MSIKSTYHKFINSPWWRLLRQKRIQKNKCCQACGSSEYLHVHHANYETKYKGEPKLALKDTFVLCGHCHCEFHKQYGVKTNMVKETLMFIKEIKEEIKYYKKMKKEFISKEDWISSI